MRKLVESETRILLELHEAGDHGNIIRILQYGWLPKPHSYFYIDMDLCDSNLHDYIYNTRKTYEPRDPFHQDPNPAYIPRELPHNMIKLRNIWTIIIHISDGLRFIHANGQAHRDLKPRNGNHTFEGYSCSSPLRSKRSLLENC